MRTKQDYVLQQKDGKFIPEKVGLKAITRDGTDYEFTLVFDIDIKHFATSSKDRTGLFMGKPEFIIAAGTGSRILDWCNSGTNLEDAKKEIKECKEIEELRATYKKYFSWRAELDSHFKLQKETIESKKELLNPQNFSSNGITNHTT